MWKELWKNRVVAVFLIGLALFVNMLVVGVIPWRLFPQRPQRYGSPLRRLSAQHRPWRPPWPLTAVIGYTQVWSIAQCPLIGEMGMATWLAAFLIPLTVYIFASALGWID